VQYLKWNPPHTFCSIDTWFFVDDRNRFFYTLYLDVFLIIGVLGVEKWVCKTSKSFNVSLMSCFFWKMTGSRPQRFLDGDRRFKLFFNFQWLLVHSSLVTCQRRVTAWNSCSLFSSVSLIAHRIFDNCWRRKTCSTHLFLHFMQEKKFYGCKIDLFSKECVQSYKI